ncbi:transglycosylase SLT domain-containing protein [Bradyrhizobium sp. Ai1a-2]|uniref:lytic transglycosylase domain-containing protein n=1 Tax=Bradyrhizobium sp. Ai1a-2 TaxID=196490 RepID=UPI000424D6AA|nr:transglycosylase SLT domain-containing protein [Bradyrhizobium sp. Ai1a-2]
MPAPASKRWRGLVAAIAALSTALMTTAGAEPATNDASFAVRFAAIEVPADTVPAPGPPSAGPLAGPSAAAKPESPMNRRDALAYYRALIEKEAGRQGLAPAIAEAVMAVESGYNPGAIGGVGEIGLMQILPSTARMLGFMGSNAELAMPENNIRYGVTYLAQAWRLAGGDLCTATMKYRAGPGETRFSHLSVNYCLAVRAKLFARGFPVTGSVPIATFGKPTALGGGCGKKCLGTAGIGRVDLAGLNTRLSTIVMQVRGAR